MLASLVYDCAFLLERDWTIYPHHVFSETKGFANGLVKRERKQLSNVKEFDSCTSFIYHYMYERGSKGVPKRLLILFRLSNIYK